MRPGEHVFMDIMHPVSRVGLTVDTTCAFYLILVDAHSRYVCLYGMCDKTIESVVRTIQHYQADHGHVGNYGYLDLKCVCAYAGTQFTSLEFKQYCWAAGIQLVLIAPKKQYQNHLAECTWQTVSTMTRLVLVHVRLPDTFMYHTIIHACTIFNVLPVKGLYNVDGNTATLEQLFVGDKPRIHHFQILGCPVVARKWSTVQTLSGKQTEQGIRGKICRF
jgi:transposase InsO family protein